jgi:hypothetical protein
MNFIKFHNTDADLLTRSDNWLKAQLKIKEQEKSKLDSEIGLLKVVLKVKDSIYKNGLVAVKRFERDQDGVVEDIAIDIVKAKDAIAELAKNGNDQDAQSYKLGQIIGWESDGVSVN